jgi:hypothetical protein
VKNEIIQTNTNLNLVSENDLYEKAEIEKIKRNLMMTDSELLKNFFNMMKLHKMLKKISIGFS